MFIRLLLKYKKKHILSFHGLETYMSVLGIYININVNLIKEYSIVLTWFSTYVVYSYLIKQTKFSPFVTGNEWGKNYTLEW